MEEAKLLIGGKEEIDERFISVVQSKKEFEESKRG